MHIHMPKPPQGWRDFFGEVAVIVVGILIALGGEALVQSWHDRHQAGKALEAIRDELVVNLGNMQSRIRTEGCIRRRLDQVAEFIDPPKGTRPTRPTWVGRPQVWLMQSSAAEAARAYGSLSLLPRDQQMAISAVYGSTTSFADLEKDEQWAWADLRSIADDRELSENDRADLRRSLQRARYAAWVLNVTARQASDQAKMLRIKAVPLVTGSKSVCIPMDTPFQTAVRLSGTADIGEPH